jgi:hypothetical protein
MLGLEQAGKSRDGLENRVAVYLQPEMSSNTGFDLYGKALSEVFGDQ